MAWRAGRHTKNCNKKNSEMTLEASRLHISNSAIPRCTAVA